MVHRAKGIIKDMEFVQFHPTALFHIGETHPAYLITEAMRGYGGILRLPNGEEFMQKYDPRLSLAPRDIVARAIDNEMKIHGLDHVCLDVTHKDPEETRHPVTNPTAATWTTTRKQGMIFVSQDLSWLYLHFKQLIASA